MAANVHLAVRRMLQLPPKVHHVRRSEFDLRVVEGVLAEEVVGTAGHVQPWLSPRAPLVGAMAEADEGTLHAPVAAVGARVRRDGRVLERIGAVPDGRGEGGRVSTC